jgi:class 3 adenylate cyclase/HAMP domain-containing protein
MNISLLVIFMIYFLTRNRKKSKATIFLIVFLIGVTIVFVSFVLIFSSLNPFYSTMAWWAIHMMVFASIAMAQFGYHFPRNVHKSESKLVLIISLVAAVLVYPYYIYRTLSMDPSYSFEGCLYAYFNTPEIGIIIGLEIAWVIVVLLRKSAFLSVQKKGGHISPKSILNDGLHVRGSRGILLSLHEKIMKIVSAEGKEAKAVRNLALIFVSPIVLIFVIVLAYVGYMSWEVVAHILGTGFIAVVFLFIVLYINNSSEPSTFMIKLVGVSLGIILITLGIASNITLSIKEDAYNRKKVIEVERFREEIAEENDPVFSSDIAYILSWSDIDGVRKEKPEILFSKPDALTYKKLMGGDIKVIAKGFPGHDISRIRRGYRAIDPLDAESLYITYDFEFDGNTYEIGYNYINYRQNIHETGMRFIYIILGSVAFVVIIMPFFFRESIVKPLNLLLEGVKQVNGGELEVVVPVGVEDEIGYLSRSFNSMVGSIRDAERRLRDSLDQQIKLTESYSCFVPKEILKFLKKESIVDIKLGDNVQEEMTILFSDIRSFTMLSEKMSPQENFNFLNSCLKRLGPVVRNNRGFIDKYIGDAVMALFPNNPNDAIKAAVDMQRSVAEYNEERAKKGYEPVEIGIGMHTGALMLGTIGEEMRMEGTVISDTVNLAARIESLTKLYGAPIIATDVTANALQEKFGFDLRYLDRVKVKGKLQWVDIYEIIDTKSDTVGRAKLKTKVKFEESVGLYQNKKFDVALQGFKSIYEINPGDKAATLYINRCMHLMEYGIPEGWNGISMMGEEYH